jgi:hypothetical protein
MPLSANQWDSRSQARHKGRKGADGAGVREDRPRASEQEQIDIVMLGGLRWQRKGLVAYKPRRLTGRGATCQTQPCARKAREYAISLAETTTPVWTKRQKGCGAGSLVVSARSITKKRTRVSCNAGSGYPENAKRSSRMCGLLLFLCVGSIGAWHAPDLGFPTGAVAHHQIRQCRKLFSVSSRPSPAPPGTWEPRLRAETPP